MSISFNGIPNDTLTPFAFVEFDASRAVQGPGVRSFKVLAIGNKLSSGTVAAETPVKVSNTQQAKDYFGAGSILANMLETYFENNKTTETYAVALDDNGTAASGSFAFSGTATSAGAANIYVGGKRISVGVNVGDTASTIAAALNTEFAKSKYENVPVDFVVSSGTINVVLKNEGAFGNELDIRVNYFDDEFLPNGISCVVTQPASGASNPDIQDAIDVIGSEQYHVIIHPYTDSSNLVKLEDELEDRWGPLTQNDGVAISAKDDTLSNLTSFAGNRNSQFSVIMGANKVPTAPWQIAGALGGNVAFYGQIDPARPLQTLQLKGVLPPAIADRFTRADRNQLLVDGIATFTAADSGVVRIERCVTTYKENAFGQEDTSFRDVETVLTLSYLRWSFRTHFGTKYPRHKLASDGTRFGAGQAIVTPKIAKAEAILLFTQWEELGLVEGFAQFKNDIVVERNSTDPNRLDFLLPPDLVNGLRVVAAKIQFLL